MTATTADTSAEKTAVLGMVIFIASWAMLFAGLFFAYGAIRVRALAWPPADLPQLPLLLPSLATAALALSSWLLERARRTGNGVPWAALAGALFLGLQVVVWRDLHAAGLRPDTGTYASVFFGLTVFHGLHVAVGLVALGWLALRRTSLSLRIWTLYWHMVGVIWGVMFFLLYLI